MATLRLAKIEHDSVVDGPGLRLTIYAQGCPHNCEGCHNPQTHDIGGGYLTDTAAVMRELHRNPLITGVTFSGGEPFLQAVAFAELAREIVKYNLNIWVYSGYTFEELKEMPEAAELLALCDVLIDGRFELRQRTLSLPWRGSENQRIINLRKALKCQG